ncbi:hypothetical protein CDL12_04778 [Handroanthus impetiginosus]|uniref:Transcription factor, Myb superfamily n=1 Tax=Handroanthus impetiginosus TaxID=429701 RepID=A0A2G9HYB1_9LAMI|nr:hypothetical protein CDL12_04778 [Handroanthus impetiginosus]
MAKEEYSDTESDDGFSEDMEALRRACLLTGENPNDGHPELPSTTGPVANGVTSASASSEEESDEGGDDDLEMVRSIQKRFAGSMDVEDEMVKPLLTLPPDWSDNDDCEDDYETLRAIQRRFAAYNDGGLKDNMEEDLHRPVQVGGTIIDSEKETSNSFIDRTNAREGFLNCVDTSERTGKKSEACDSAGGTRHSDLAVWNEPGGDDDVAGLPVESSHFPKSALAFVDAIKKNRSCQKFIRSKMMQMEARIEELNQLKERVKILKDFQVACKKRTGRALSQKKDARVQLISVPKRRANVKFNEKNIPAVYKGPPENSHVANYKEALATFAVSVSHEKWSDVERENLVKGVKQQFQEMLLQRSVDLLSEADGSYDSSNVDSIIVSIKDLDITPEKIRSFLPKVNWEQLASMYVPSRSGAECQARFLNWEDPLVNHSPWTAMEDKNLLHIVQQRGLSNWIDIAASLGTNRTPFQCLARYQRSLNASILKREWTKEEDNQLRAAVETYGESNWQLVASVVEGRTGTQCSNRWLKTLNPARKRVGKWTAEEDKRLKVAVTLFGPKTWKKVAKYVSGRTQVQCRERWVNCLDPSLNTAPWADEEDSKLEAAIAEHGYCWSKVAACIPHRTDNQCWRRWKVLFPDDVPRLQAARKIQKAALISNFVDRESERPALGPSDFILPETYRITGSENVDPSRRNKRRSRGSEAQEHMERDALSGGICSEEVPRLTNGSEVENLQGRSMSREGRGKHARSMKKIAGPTSDSQLSSCVDTALLDMSNGEEIRKSHVNGSSGNGKPQLRNKRSSVKSKSVDGAPRPDSVCEGATVIEPTSNECLLPTLTYPDSQVVTVGNELGSHDVTQCKKASKLQPRRRRAKMLEGIQETLSEVDLHAGEAAILKTKRETKRAKKKQSSATDDQPLDSMPLMDIMKRKRKTQGTCPRGDCVSPAVDDRSICGDKSSCQVEIDQQSRGNMDILVSANIEDSVLSETEDDNITLASFLLQSSAKVGKSPRKKASQVRMGSTSAEDQNERRRTRDGTCSSQLLDVDIGPKNDNEVCRDQALESEIEDDTTLAHVYNRLKKRRTEAP